MLTGSAKPINSSPVNVQSGCALDVTQLSGGLALSATQSLVGGGTLLGNIGISGTDTLGAGVGVQAITGTASYASSSCIAWKLAGNSALGPGSIFDQFNSGTALFAGGAALDVNLNSAGSTVNFGNSFWAQSHTWPVMTATTLSETCTLRNLTPDINGHAAAVYGAFSLQPTGTALNLTWTPNPPYKVWQNLNFGSNADNPSIVGDTESPSSDGISNLMKYALGMNPQVSAAPGGLLTSVLQPGSFSVIYNQADAATEVALSVQWSSDLAQWYSTGVTSQLLSDDGTTQRIKASVPVSAATRKFMRIQVSRP